MRKDILVNGKSLERFPNCWDDLTIDQHQRIYSQWKDELVKPVEERDYFKLFVIFSGVEFKTFLRTPENEEAVWSFMRWAITDPIPYSTAVPTEFTVPGFRTVTVPKQVQSLSIGQNIVVIQAIEKEKFLEASCSRAVAVYLQPLLDEKPFSKARALEIEQAILQMPAKEVYGLGFFLLMRAVLPGNWLLRVWLLIQNNLSQKSKRMLPGSQEWIDSQSFAISR